MPVTVHHWPYQLNFAAVGVGHVALEVVSPAGNRYLSWYPEQSKSPDALIATTPRNHTKVEDVDHGGTAPDVVRIEGLDEPAIVTFIDQPHPYYSLFGTSCAQMVADALRAGIGGKYAAGIMNLNPVWTPQTAADFARRIRAKLRTG